MTISVRFTTSICVAVSAALGPFSVAQAQTASPAAAPVTAPAPAAAPAGAPAATAPDAPAALDERQQQVETRREETRDRLDELRGQAAASRERHRDRIDERRSDVQRHLDGQGSAPAAGR